MSYEQACEARDNGLSAYDLQIAKAPEPKRAQMQLDRDSLAFAYDEWIKANFS